MARNIFASEKKTKNTSCSEFLEIEISKKYNAVIIRCVFRNRNIKKIPYSDHFWKLRYRKNEGDYNAKFISKLTYIKHIMFGAFLEATISKKYT